MSTTYEIVSRLDINDDWSNDGIGDPNVFDTAEDAVEAIDQLRTLGEEWQRYMYAVRVRGDVAIFYLANEYEP